MTDHTDLIRRTILAETAGWSPAQRAALLHRLDRETTRATVAQQHPTAGALAQAIETSTVQTPALEAIDQALEWALSTRDARLAISMPPQEGKLVAHDTPVPTPTGWTTHGELRPGDQVMHPSGRPVTVTAIHPEAMATMRVHIDGNDHIDVHPQHEWTIHRNGRPAPRTIETQWLADHAITTGPAGRRGCKYLSHLPHREVFTLPDANLPIDPYTLGLWLGDGRASGAYIHHDAADDYQYAYPVTSTWTHKDTGVVQDYLGGGFLTALRALGLLGNRHIPSVYLRASEAQRRALLAGLIDSDGHVPATGNQVCFDNTNRRLVADVAELVRTLGYRAGEHRPIAPSDGGTGVHGQQITGRREMWRIAFSPHDGIVSTRLPRYEGRITARAARRRIPITGIEPIPPRPGRCITVDAPDGLYLVGRTMVPTHNSQRVGVWGVVRALVQDPERRVVLASYAEHLARGMARQVRDIIREHGHGARDPLTGAPLVDKLGLALADDNASAGSWQLAGHKGGLFAVGVGGGLTGKSAEVLVIDDPLKGMSEADSVVEREKVITWYDSVAQTRLAAGAPVIIIQTRWHEDDLTGHVLAQDKQAGRSSWRVVNIPAVSTPGVPDALGRPAGEAMQSARGRTPEDFARIRQDVGERVWSALYLGQPTPAGGGLFAREWFDRHRAPNVGGTTAARIVSVDPAETGKADEAGIIGLTVTADGRAWVADDRSGRMQSDEWARTAVLLALETQATEVLFEAFTTGPTYERVIEEAWRRVRDEARLLRTHNNDLAAAALAYARKEDRPADPLASIRQIDGVPIPDQTDPPFRIRPWRAKGDKVARAAGTRQAASTGRLRMVGTHPELEEQATRWLPGQDSPDRMDALVNGYERCMQIVGAEAQIATPGMPTASPAPSPGVGPGFWASPIG